MRSIPFKKQDKTRQELPEKPDKINFAFSANLIQEIENWLRANWTNTPATSTADFVRRSLEAYRIGNLGKLDFGQRPGGRKKNITVRWTRPEQLNYYYSLPFKLRTAILELSVLKYYEKLKKELEEKKESEW